MTAPAVSAIPTPGDLARRTPTTPAARPKPAAPRAHTKPARPATYEPRQLSPEEAIAPGRLTKAEHFRKFYLFGLRRSGMTSSARLVAHDLMWRASHATGRISPSMQPPIEHLALATGLTTTQVNVAINTLHSRGWLNYRRLQDGPRTGQDVMVLTIPAGALEELRVWAAKRPNDGFSH